MAAIKIGGLAQHIARHLNRNSQYGLDEAFVGKEYHSIDYQRSVIQLQHSELQLIRTALNQGVLHFLCGQAITYLSGYVFR